MCERSENDCIFANMHVTRFRGAHLFVFIWLPFWPHVHVHVYDCDTVRSPVVRRHMRGALTRNATTLVLLSQVFLLSRQQRISATRYQMQASSSAVPDVDASQLDVTELWARIRNHGHFPRRHPCPENEVDEQGNDLWTSLYRAKWHIPDDVWGDMRSYGIHQPMSKTQKLLDEIRNFGNHPKKGKTRSRAENLLARRLQKAIKKKEFNHEQLTELEGLSDASVSTAMVLDVAANGDASQLGVSFIVSSR